MVSGDLGVGILFKGVLSTIYKYKIRVYKFE